MIIFKENILKAEDVILFQRKMNWNVDSIEQWEKSLKNSLFTVSAYDHDELVGMGRLLGDGVIYWYLNDIFVLSEFQGKGIGREIVQRLIDHIKKAGLSKTEVPVCLMSAMGKEGFYEKLGFRSRPHEYEGAGMELVLMID